MSTADKYVAAAYLVFLVAVLVYLVIHSLRIARLERELADLAARAMSRRAAAEREELSVG